MSEQQPMTKGLLAGEQMSIAWTVWPIDRKSERHPVDLAVEYTPDPKVEQTYLVEGRVMIDPIWVARAAGDPPRWNEVLVQAARLLVEDAAKRDARLRTGVNAKGGAS